MQDENTDGNCFLNQKVGEPPLGAVVGAKPKPDPDDPELDSGEEGI